MLEANVRHNNLIVSDNEKEEIFYPPPGVDFWWPIALQATNGWLVIVFDYFSENLYIFREGHTAPIVINVPYKWQDIWGGWHDLLPKISVLSRNGKTAIEADVPDYLTFTYEIE